MTILVRICSDKLGHIERQRALVPYSALEKKIADALPTRGFINALKQKSPALIAEVKKASPSKGIIRADFDPVKIAKIYEDNGASCISVLTDELYFQGRDEYLAQIRQAVSLPLLRKDFMLEDYQILESRALGADCILLIMAALTDAQAKTLYALATDLSLDTLFEVHDEEELERALALNPQMVGVNNRNLKTLDVDLGTGLNLAASIPDNLLKVAESGIPDFETFETFQAAGFSAFLIGESLMRENDIGKATRAILGA
ncbi:MAG TPA: indole-3-glycerol phosphate synthase TrpC [Micavibrio sp.]|nr:indole-3-glycerol phosphate synthase TrpC [Micavibrio sp.]